MIEMFDDEALEAYREYLQQYATQEAQALLKRRVEIEEALSNRLFAFKPLKQELIDAINCAFPDEQPITDLDAIQLSIARAMYYANVRLYLKLENDVGE